MTDNVNATLKLFGYITPEQYQVVAMYHAEKGIADPDLPPIAWDNIFQFDNVPAGAMPRDLLATLSDIKRDPRCRLGFVWGYARGDSFGPAIEVYDAGPTAVSRSYTAWEGGIVISPTLATDPDVLRQAVNDANTAHLGRLTVLRAGEELPPVPPPVWQLQVEIAVRVPGMIEVAAVDYAAAVETVTKADYLAENFIPEAMTEESQFQMFLEAGALCVMSYATAEVSGDTDGAVYPVT